MNTIPQLRQQAEFCLRLSQACGDPPMSRHLSSLAARYHETALLAEFGFGMRVDARAAADDHLQEAMPAHH